MLREKLADLCHKQWSGWMKYLFSKGTLNDDGTWTMPVWAVERWTRQMTTPLEEMPPEEQDTDRRQADKFIEALEDPCCGGIHFETIDGKWWRFREETPIHALSDTEAASVIWG